MIEEAQAAGLPVAAHVQTERGARNAIEAGVTSTEHGWVLTDEDLLLAKKKGIVLVPTDTPEVLFAYYGMDPTRAKRTFESHRERLRRAYLAGVPIAFGTDIMFDTLEKSRGELALEFVGPMAEASMPPGAILKAMTSDAAKLLRVDQQRGSVRVGLAADLIAVRGNPLASLDALKQIVFVMKSGTIIRNQAAQ